MSDKELRDDVNKLKKRESRRRVFFWIKIIIYSVIGIGIAFYVFQSYVFAQSLEDPNNYSFEIKKPDRTGFLQYDLNFEIYLRNPTVTTFSIENMELEEITVEGVYVGSLYERNIEVKPGWTPINLTFSLDLQESNEIPVKRIVSNKEMTVGVKGSVDVPIKVFGLITWKTIPIPIELTEKVPVDTDVSIDLRDNVGRQTSSDENKQDQSTTDENNQQSPSSDESMKEKFDEGIENIKEKLPVLP